MVRRAHNSRDSDDKSRDNDPVLERCIGQTHPTDRGLLFEVSWAAKEKQKTQELKVDSMSRQGIRSFI